MIEFTENTSLASSTDDRPSIYLACKAGHEWENDLSVSPVSSVAAEKEQPAHLLVVSDKPILMRKQLRRALSTNAHQMHAAISGREAISLLQEDQFDLVLLDLDQPEIQSQEIYHQIRQVDARIPVIFITADSSAESAIEAMRQGAFDYLFKPVDPDRLKETITHALEVARLGRETTAIPDLDDPNTSAAHSDTIVGRCPAMGEVYKAIGRVADRDVLVLITGESGTGKELIARAVYQHSKRAGKPFLAINCAAIPDNLLESELFGHEKGAFTGADRRRIGKFEQCSGGTIFLDEIGDMPLATQAKILRLLQNQTFERVGGNETITTDVRIIAATNRNLKQWADKGKFRTDLFYRLNVFTIHLPPLRQRGDDLALLVKHHLHQLNHSLGREIRDVAPEAMAKLQHYTWPGNIRELQSVLKQSLLHASGTVLLPSFISTLPMIPDHDIPERTDKGWSALNAFIQRGLHEGTTELNAEAQLAIDRILLPAVLNFTGANQVRAAKILGLSRQTLRLRLRNIGRTVTRTI